MSKDIRSFFSVKSSSTQSQKKNVPAKNQSEPFKKTNNKKRAAIIIDSDSDEEDARVAKRNKLSPKSEKSPEKKKVESPKVTSKYFKQEEVGIDSLFAARPVKRDNSRNIIKRNKKEVVEHHNDKAFEKELLSLDGKKRNDTAEKEDVTHMEMEKSSEVEKHFTNEITNGTNEILDEEIGTPKKKMKLNDEGKSMKIISSDNTPSKESKPNNKVHSLSPASSPCRSSPRSKRNLSPLSSPARSSSSRQLTTLSPLSSPKSISSRSSPRTQTSKSSSQEKSSQQNESPRKSLFVSSPPAKSLVKTKTPIKDKFDQNQNSESILKGKKNIFKTKSGVKDESKQSRSAVETKSAQINVVKELPKGAELLVEAPSNLWVEKYKPNTIKQIIGQQGDKSCVNKLLVWLKNWHKNQSGNKKMAKPSPWAKNDDGAFFKAALLSGPPGVGKTTTAHLVSKDLGFDIVEFNASDTRSKKLLHQEVSELLSTNSLSPFFTGKGEQVTKQHVLVMDEVDGMAGNEDRGGVQELILLIKQSRIPIICMCNDRNHPKIRSLANYCFDLRFSKPRVEQIKGAMMSMCFKEKLKIAPNVLADIISSANQDIRLIINHLSMLKMENSQLAHSTKHIKLGPWDITRKIFSEEEHKSMSIYDKSDLFFHDYSVTPLFVHENYLNAVPHKPEGKDKRKKMELFAKAATSLSLGDRAEKLIRSHNAWSLLPTQAIFSSVVPGDVLEGHLGGQITFPAWFGKNSRQSKLSRLVQELTVHSRLRISGSKESMNLDYRGALESNIVTPLVKEGVEGVPESLAVLAEYCLVREDIESLSELSTWPNTTSLFSRVDSKVKAAFTRAYNKTSAPTPYAAASVKRGRGEVDNIDSLPDEEEETSQEPDDEQEDDPNVDSMIVVKKKPASKKAEKEAVASTSKGNKNAKKRKK